MALRLLLPRIWKFRCVSFRLMDCWCACAAVFIAKNAVLSSFAMGRQTSLVVDVGHDSTVGELSIDFGSRLVTFGLFWHFFYFLDQQLGWRQLVRSAASRWRS